MRTVKRPNPTSHNGRLLAALEHAQLYAPDGWLKDPYDLKMVVHSRVSNLRHMGHGIEHKRFGTDDHRYRLMPPEESNGQLRIACCPECGSIPGEFCQGTRRERVANHRSREHAYQDALVRREMGA